MKLLEASFELIVPLIVAMLIDQGIANRDHGMIWRCCLWMILLALVGFCSAVTAQYFAAKAAMGFGKKVKQALFEHIQLFSFRQLDRFGEAGLLNRLTNDVNQVQNGVNQVLRLFLRSPFIVFGAMVMAFTVDTRGAIIFVILIPLLSLAVAGVTLFSLPLMRKAQKRLDILTRIARENLTGTRVIRAFHREETEVHRFRKENRTLTGYQTTAGRISALLNPMTFIIVNVSLVMLLHKGSYRVFDGELTRGELVALINYMSQILVELIKLANLIVSVTKASASAVRLKELFETQPDMQYPKTSPVGDGSGCVCFEDVSLSYFENAAPAIDHITFTAPRGATIGILGGTGSGKTTLVNALGRLYDVTAGCVTINGEDVRKYAQEDLRNMVGYVLQKATLMSGTVADNLRMGAPDATPEEMQQALQIAQAWDFLEKKDGLQTRVESGGRNFSGGQQQRLSVARTLVTHPQVLVLDDSGSALDYATDANMRRAIAQMPDRPTLFIVSQRTSSVMGADLILVLDDGKCVGMGDHETLLATFKQYREIYETQFRDSVAQKDSQTAVGISDEGEQLNAQTK